MRVRLLVAGLAVTAVSAAASDAAPRNVSCLGQRVTIVGTNRSEVLRGTNGPDVIAARGGNDVVHARGGVDRVCGGTGRDRIDAGEGSDWIDGGPGLVDAASYASATGGVVVDLGVGRAEGAGSDRLVRLEWAVGSPFADRLSGSRQSNVLFGSGGDDVLIFDGVGSDRYEGGTGSDTISFASYATRVTADLEDGAVGKPTGIDGLVRIENIIGTPYNDGLTGNAAPNRIEGGASSDTIYGLAGDDVLLGGEDRDVFFPGAGSDHVDGQGGDDRVEYFWDAPGHYGPTVDASLTTGRAVDHTGTDVLVSLTNLHGTLGNDRLEGSEEANSLWGAGGDDFLYGRGGDDWLGGGRVLDGGPGTDTCTAGSIYVDCELP